MPFLFFFLIPRRLGYVLQSMQPGATTGEGQHAKAHLFQGCHCSCRLEKVMVSPVIKSYQVW